MANQPLRRCDGGSEYHMCPPRVAVMDAMNDRMGLIRVCYKLIDPAGLRQAQSRVESSVG